MQYTESCLHQHPMCTKKQAIVSILEALSADYMSSANNNNNHELAQ